MKRYKAEKRAVPIGRLGEYDHTVSAAVSTSPKYVPYIINFKCRTAEEAAELRERFMEYVRTGNPMCFDDIYYI